MALSHLNQCWPWSLSPYCVTRAEWKSIPITRFFAAHLVIIWQILLLNMTSFNPTSQWIKKLAKWSTTFAINFLSISLLPVLQAYLLIVLATLMSKVNSILTYCGLVTPYGDKVQVNIGSGNGLLPDGTKPLPEPMLKKCSRYQPLMSVWKLWIEDYSWIS